MMPALLQKLLQLIKKGVSWLVVMPEKPDFNFNSPSKTINIRNLNIENYTININKEAQDFNQKDLDAVLASAADDIKNHKGIGLEFDPSLSIATKQNLTSTQRNQIKLFKQEKWGTDKIVSIRIAFKIINLEDTAQYEEASKLMESAFNGRKKVMNKKLYNLARAGYLEGFAMQLMFSSELHSDESINKKLEYFPEAIFIDDGMDALKFIQELQRRDHDGISRVAVYARGGNHIGIFDYFYDQYMSSTLKKGTEGVRFYIIASRENYKIGANDAVRTELELMSVKTHNF